MSIDAGDRVVVKSDKNILTGFGSSDIKPQHLGMHGVVLNNDGWGHCKVELDNGDKIMCWNSSHLVLEDKGS